MNYQIGLKRMQDLLASHDPEHIMSLSLLEARLSENIKNEQKYGSEPSNKAERYRVLEELNRLALESCNITFTQLCLEKSSSAIVEIPVLPTDQIDVAIITVREDEYEAVHKRLENPQEFYGKEHTYVRSSVPYVNSTGKAGNYNVALVRCIGQGTDAGQDTARDAIEDLRPKLLMLVGIAGGIPSDEFSLGDVILATQVQDYSVSSFVQNELNNKVEFAFGGGPMDKSVQDLFAAAGHWMKRMQNWNDSANISLPQPDVDIDDDRFYGDSQWNKSLKASLNKRFHVANNARKPKVITGSTASSGILVKDTELVRKWKETARNIVNVEMELAGVYRAARRKGREYPIVAIRGISDIVGYKRDSEWTIYACEVAASFAMNMLKNGNLPFI